MGFWVEVVKEILEFRVCVAPGGIPARLGIRMLVNIHELLK